MAPTPFRSACAQLSDDVGERLAPAFSAAPATAAAAVVPTAVMIGWALGSHVGRLGSGERRQISNQSPQKRPW
jgi:hypothetical protein